MANVGSGASGKTLIGAGNGASPTYADIGTNSGLTANGVVISQGNGAFQSTSSGLTGQILVSSGAGFNPTYQFGGSLYGMTITGNSGGALFPSSGNWNIVGTGGVTTTGSGNTLTISVDAEGIPWTNVTGVSDTMAKNNGYQANNAGLVTLTMPSVASSSFGDTIKIAGFGAGGWLIQCVATQLIHLGSIATSAAGSIASTNRYDAIELVCSSTTTEWFARPWVGNLTTA